MPLVVVTRYLVRTEVPEFAEQGRAALAALTGQPGCLRGHFGRALDEPEYWLLQTEWQSTGSYRRALSSYDVKLHAVPVMYRAVDEPTAYEVLTQVDQDGTRAFQSDRSQDSQTASPGRRAPE